MAILTGPVYTPAPNPVVPRPGLFQVATGPLDLPVHGRIGGIQYETHTCSLPQCYEVECFTDHNTKTLTAQKSVIVGSPFVVFSNLLCTPVGLDDPRTRMFLYDNLSAGEQATVENTFSLQSCAQAPGLSNNAAVVNLTPTPGTAVDIVKAVSLAESWLYARYGLPGIIHMPESLAAYAAYTHLVDPSGGRWTSVAGTKFSFGNYAGFTPVGVAPAVGETWIYITGQVAIWRTADSDLFVTSIADVLNRTTNQLTAVMEREYVVTIDCFVAGVQVKQSGVVA